MIVCLAAGIAVAQTANRSAMTVGTADAGAASGSWAGVPDVPLTPPRGTSWGPGGYQGGDMPVPIAGVAHPAEPLRSPSSGGIVAADDGWGDDGRAAQAGPPQGVSRDWLRVGPGSVVPAYLRTSAYFVTDWRSYGLGEPGPGRRWIRYYDDALLIDRSGNVLGTRYDMRWTDRAPRQAAAGAYYQSGDYDRGVRPEPAPVYQDIQVQRSGANAPNVTVRRNPDGSTTVTIVNEGQQTSTTHYDGTVTTYEEPVVTYGEPVVVAPPPAAPRARRNYAERR